MTPITYDITINRIEYIGNYNGYDYLIYNYGTHPCCYVKIPVDHKLYLETNYDLPVNVHGGLSFAGKLNRLKTEDWYLGWDYCHFGDFSVFEHIGELEGHKYTLEEIIKDAESVIDQLINLYDD